MKDQKLIDAIITAVMKTAVSIGAAVAVLIASEHRALVALLLPVMREFKRTTSDPKEIKKLRATFTLGMLKSKKYKAMLKPAKTRGARKTMICNAWADAEGRKTKRNTKRGSGYNAAATSRSVYTRTTWPQYIETLARMLMECSPEQLKKVDAKVERLHHTKS